MDKKGENRGGHTPEETELEEILDLESDVFEDETTDEPPKEGGVIRLVDRAENDQASGDVKDDDLNALFAQEETSPSSGEEAQASGDAEIDVLEELFHDEDAPQPSLLHDAEEAPAAERGVIAEPFETEASLPVSEEEEVSMDAGMDEEDLLELEEMPPEKDDETEAESIQGPSDTPEEPLATPQGEIAAVPKLLEKETVDQLIKETARKTVEEMFPQDVADRLVERFKAEILEALKEKFISGLKGKD